jgi:hypothetical protein
MHMQTEPAPLPAGEQPPETTGEVPGAQVRPAQDAVR